MKFIYRIIFIIIFSCLSGKIYSQSNLRPKGIRVGTELTAIGQTLFSNYRSQYEVSSDLQLGKYLVNFGYGIADFNREETDYDFSTSGSYFRTGIDINFINNLPASNAIFIGLRYARSTFSNELVWQIDHPVYGRNTLRSEENDLIAHWLEAVAGIKVNVWNNFFLGFTIRNKFFKRVNGVELLEPYDIPGYGIGAADNFWDFDYYLYYRLPFQN